MKVTIIYILLIGIANTKSQEVDNGQYHPDDEGKYIHDDSGRYFPDKSGQYLEDGTGKYSDTEKKYQQFNSRFRDQGRVYSSPRPFALRSRSIKSNSNLSPTAAPKLRGYDDGRWRVIRLSSDVDKEGFHWEYETENNIVGEETARIHNRGSQDEIIRAKGFYKYTGPDNVIYNVEYTADENGFIPKGNHLPPTIRESSNQNLKFKNI